MGIITELIFNARMKKAIEDDKPGVIDDLLDEQERMHEYRLRGENRVARWMKSLFAR